MKEKRFLVWQRCDGGYAFFTGAFNAMGAAIWTRNQDYAAHYVEGAAALLAQSLGESIREVGE